jgi:hypothetical protein
MHRPYSREASYSSGPLYTLASAAKRAACGAHTHSFEQAREGAAAKHCGSEKLALCKGLPGTFTRAERKGNLYIRGENAAPSWAG